MTDLKKAPAESARMYELAQKRAKYHENKLSYLKRIQKSISICAYCKKIRDDEGTWNQVESYKLDYLETDFSSLICPECYEKAIEDFKLY